MEIYVPVKDDIVRVVMHQCAWLFELPRMENARTLLLSSQYTIDLYTQASLTIAWICISKCMFRTSIFTVSNVWFCCLCDIDYVSNPRLTSDYGLVV